MRVGIIKDDGVVGVDGIFRTVDLSDLPEGVRAVQWNGSTGHVEYDDMGNTALGNMNMFQTFIDRWTAAAPVVVPPTPAEMIAAAHARINAAYEATINAAVAGYPDTEIASWPKQESEARAWIANNATPTPWIDGAANARGISKQDFVELIIANADALAPLHGAMTGKRQSLRDQIDALGATPTQGQLDSIQW